MSEGKKEILLGDCLELMKDIPNESIDMILADLPYGTTACKWDVIIPFDKLWEQYERIIKPNGAIVLFGSEPFSSLLRTSNLKRYKYDWIWEKTKAGNFQIVKHQPLKYHEIISVFSLKKHNYYPIKVKASESSISRYKYNISKSKGKLNHIASGVFNYSENHDKEFKNPSSIIKHKSEIFTLHPTQKPVALFEYLIKTYTNENNLVLDNTAGSGTTAIACLNTNRQFIVMEKEQKYYNIILKRVADFNKNIEMQTLFGNEM